MKVLLLIACAFILAFMATWGIVAFIRWDLNLFNLDMEIRGSMMSSCISLGSCLSLVGCMLFHDRLFNK